MTRGYILRAKRLSTVLLAHGPWCHYCNRVLFSTAATLDHKLPPAYGGGDGPLNLVPACRSCNASKQQHTAPQTHSRLRRAGCHCSPHHRRAQLTMTRA